MGPLRRILDAFAQPLRSLVQSPRSFLSAPQRIMKLSLPARVAVLTFIALLVAIVAGFVYYLTDPNRAPLFNWLAEIFPALVLALVIPLVAYQAVRLWLRGDVSPFPDIEKAWKEGLAALEQQGWNLSELPIFLVLGARDADETASLFHAAFEEFRLSGAPDRNAPLQWYANDRGVYLVCRNLGQMSQLTPGGQRGGVGNGPALREARPGESLKATLAAGQAAGDVIAAPGAARPEPRPVPPPRQSIYQTIVADVGLTADYLPVAALPDSRETERQSARLRYLCQLLHQARQPTCPVNGILALLSFDLVYRRGRDVRIAAQGDLATLREALRLRCPTVALFDDMHREEGFVELIKRLRAHRAHEVRYGKFGKGASPWWPSTGENVEAVVKHACGAFEDFTYQLFVEPDGLSKPGNLKLFSLLCKIRSYIVGELSQILCSVFDADETSGETANRSLLFGGCYFGAAGTSDASQAFIAGPLGKLREVEAELAWGQDALAEDQRCQRLAEGLWMVCGGLVLALLGLLLWRMFRR